MNIANNQRFQETDRRIKDTMLELIRQKEFSKITVHDICKGCGINRSTFYAHFVDIYDLMGKIQQDIHRDAIDSFQGIDFDPAKYLTLDYLTPTLYHIRRNRPFYCAYFTMGMKDINQLGDLVQQRYMEPFMCSLGITSERQIQYHFRFFWAGFIEVIRIWVMDGCPEEPEELCRFIEKSIHTFPEQGK